MHSTKLPHLSIKHSAIRARTRLNRTANVTHKGAADRPIRSKTRFSRLKKISWVPRFSINSPIIETIIPIIQHIGGWLLARRTTLLWLMIFLLALTYLLVAIRPSTVANLLLSQTYLPLLLLVGGSAYSFSRLFVSRLTASALSLSAVFVLSVKVHHVVLPDLYWAGLVLFLVFLCSGAVLVERMLAKRQISDILRHSKVSKFIARRKRT